jgi:transcriptional regulator with XRE-family HTH domain
LSGKERIVPSAEESSDQAKAPAAAEPSDSTPAGAAIESPSLGAFIRAQRQLSDMSLRQLAAVSNVSNAYLSQIERGLHQPSLKVVRAIAEALNIPTEYLLSQSGVLDAPDSMSTEQTSTESAILADPILTADEKEVVLGVYRTLRQRHTGS